MIFWMEHIDAVPLEEAPKEMQFHQYLISLIGAVKEENAQRLGSLLKITGPNSNELLRDLHDSRVRTNRTSSRIST
jgi:hypothetical protein